jgi:hypothetical protein
MSAISILSTIKSIAAPMLNVGFQLLTTVTEIVSMVLPAAGIICNIIDKAANIFMEKVGNSFIESVNKADQEAAAKLTADQEAKEVEIVKEAQLKAEEEAQLKAQEEAQLKAQEEIQLKAQEEAQLKAQEEAKAEEADMIKSEVDIALQNSFFDNNEQEQSSLRPGQNGGGIPPLGKDGHYIWNSQTEEDSEENSNDSLNESDLKDGELGNVFNIETVNSNIKDVEESEAHVDGDNANIGEF